jgi:hypothetical protein
MCTTTHTVADKNGQAKHVNVKHVRIDAIQYDFYIPAKIWKAKRVQTFISRLGSLESGATIFLGLIGVWNGEAEQTLIYRMILRANKYNRNNVASTLRSEIGNLKAELSVTKERQDEFMYTETEIKMNQST